MLVKIRAAFLFSFFVDPDVRRRRWRKVERQSVLSDFVVTRAAATMKRFFRAKKT